MFIRGKHATGPGAALNAIPTGLLPDSASQSYSDWESNRNDPYLRGWSVKNLGSRNSGLPGDVILSWFKPLDESLDGEKWSDEVYIMVTNGLCDVRGSGEQCRQEITLNFVNHPATATVQKLDRHTGRLQDVPLPLSGQRRQLVLKLEGGTCELFKFKTGAPFVGVETGHRSGVSRKSYPQLAHRPNRNG